MSVQSGEQCMRQLNLDALQRLFDLKAKGIITEPEYDFKKIEILRAETPAPDIHLGASAPDHRKLGHGVSSLIGAVVLLLITAGLLSDEQSSKDDLQKALGMIFLFGAWLIPHSIWLLTKRGANVVLPIIALALTGLCGLAYVGSL